MASTKHKKRGSTLTLVILLFVLVAVTAYLLISSDVVTKAEASEGIVSTLVEQSPEDLAKTTLINAGDMAPDFTVKMLDGSEVTLSKLQGHIIDRYGDSINVLPISRGEERAKVDEYITKMGYTFAVGLDGDQSIYQKYATNYIPRCFVIDAEGKVLYSGVGYDEKVAAEVEQSINKALRK